LLVELEAELVRKAKREASNGFHLLRSIPVLERAAPEIEAKSEPREEINRRRGAAFGCGRRGLPLDEHRTHTC
jgi:hypothetical protein